VKIGIDAGGTRIKVAIAAKGSFQFMAFPSSELEQAAAIVNDLNPSQLCITGGRADALQAHLAQRASEMVEFEATVRGVRHLLAEEGRSETDYVVTNVGTGTSIHHVEGNRQRRLGGTGIGGGTLLGLARLLTGLSDYHEIIRLAALGKRDRLDLKVHHIYEGKEPPIPGDLTASNFGNVLSHLGEGKFSREELLAAVVGLVGETVATTSVLAIPACSVSTVVFVGSSFVQNESLKEVVAAYTKLRGATPIFITNGEYSGALGTIL